MHPQMSGASMIEVDDLASAPGEITAAQWRQIVNGATDTAIISTDQRGIVSSWNSGAGCILGWSEPEMLGKSLGRIFADGDGQARLSREMEAMPTARAAARKDGASARTGAASGGTKRESLESTPPRGRSADQ
jgi:PAS domain-containing protein